MTDSAGITQSLQLLKILPELCSLHNSSSESFEIDLYDEAVTVRQLSTIAVALITVIS